MTLPHTTHPGRRDVQAAFFQLVGRAHLTPRRLGDRQLGHRLLDLRHHPVLQDRLAPRDFLQRRLAALVVEFLEAVEAVAGSPSPGTPPTRCRAALPAPARPPSPGLLFVPGSSPSSPSRDPRTLSSLSD